MLDKKIKIKLVKIKLHPHEMIISRLRLATFVLVFAAIGVGLILFSHATTAILATLEAETMILPAGASIVTDSTASGGHAMQLSTNGTAIGQVSISSASNQISITAKGGQCNGAPQAVVKVDNITVQNSYISSGSWTAYYASLNIASGSHTVSVSFINDYTSYRHNRVSCSRDLYVDKVTFYGDTSAIPTPAPVPTPTSVTVKRGVAQAMYDVNNQVLNSGGYNYGLRFVLDKDTPIYRFISGFNLEGVTSRITCSVSPCRTGYGGGTGGTINARLVTVNSDGTPNLNNVLAQETVGAVQRWQESESAYAIPAANDLMYFNMGGVMLTGGQMYAMVYRNVDPNPGSNWFSTNSPVVKESAAGPNGVNNLDPNAPGAVNNLDPREAISWSTDSGSSWVWGRLVGSGTTAGSYAGSATDDSGTRLPWYGWQTSSTAQPQTNQPYYAYKESASYALTITNTTSGTLTFTQAGGYAPVGSSVGVITVTNTITGTSATTSNLGSGLVQGSLSNTISVAPGQTYQVSNSGTVMLEEADSFQRAVFGMGSSWPVQTTGHGPARAALFAK